MSMPIIANPNGRNNYMCDNCGKPMYSKPSHIKKTKRVCCSYSCSAELRKLWFRGENNHQYGLTKDLNPSYIDKHRKTKNGYAFVRDYSHPFAQKDGWIWEHRVVAERYLLKKEDSVIIKGKKYLKPDLHVHHKDRNKLNNKPNNLLIMTRSEHTRLHNLLCPMPKDQENGRFLKCN